MSEQCQRHAQPIEDCPWEESMRSPSDEPGYVDVQYICGDCGRVYFTTEGRDE